MKNRFLLDVGREEWSKLLHGTFSFYEKNNVLYLLVIVGNKNDDSGSSELCMTGTRHRLAGNSSIAFLDRRISLKLSLAIAS